MRRAIARTLLLLAALAACEDPVVEDDARWVYMIFPHTLAPNVLFVEEGDRIGDCGTRDRCQDYRSYGLDHWEKCFSLLCDVPYGWAVVDADIMERLRVGEHCDREDADGNWDLAACFSAAQFELDNGPGLTRDGWHWTAEECGAQTWVSERLVALEGETASGVLPLLAALSDTIQISVEACQ